MVVYLLVGRQIVKESFEEQSRVVVLLQEVHVGSDDVFVVSFERIDLLQKLVSRSGGVFGEREAQSVQYICIQP